MWVEMTYATKYSGKWWKETQAFQGILCSTKPSKGCTNKEHSPKLEGWSILSMDPNCFYHCWGLRQRSMWRCANKWFQRKLSSQAMHWLQERMWRFLSWCNMQRWIHLLFFLQFACTYKFLDKKFSLLHARVLFLLCDLDHLHHSIKFTREAFIRGSMSWYRGDTQEWP